MADIPTWLLLALAIFAATAFFAFCYRRALIWFVRARIDTRWTSAAELMTLTGSLPFALMCGLLSVELSRWVGSVILNMGLSLRLLAHWLNLLEQYRLWLVAGIAAVFLAYVVPQTIATSKVYAVCIEAEINQSEK